jgi:phage I-like protein
MNIKQNADGKWCIYNGEEKLGDEYDTEDEAKAAMQALSARRPVALLDFTVLAGMDLKDAVTQDLASEAEVQIALPGHYIQGAKEFDITVKDFQEAEKNFLAAENPLPVDYEHNTFVKGAEAPAAGWVKKVINRGEQGLYAVIAWTKGAAEKIRAGEYKFISPVLFFNARDTKTGKAIGTLLGPPALTNFPLIQGMEPVTAKKIDLNEKEKRMKEFSAKLFAALGIDGGNDEIAEDKAIELIKAKMTPAKNPPQIVAAKGVLEVLELPEEATEGQVKGAILALKNPGNTVSTTEYNELKAELQRRDIDHAVEKALLDGKIAPAEKAWAKEMAEGDLTTFNAFIAKRPQVVPIAMHLPKGNEKKGVEIDALQAEINRQLGVKSEQFLKYNH